MNWKWLKGEEGYEEGRKIIAGFSKADWRIAFWVAVIAGGLLLSRFLFQTFVWSK